MTGITPPEMTRWNAALRWLAAGALAAAAFAFPILAVVTPLGIAVMGIILGALTLPLALTGAWRVLPRPVVVVLAVLGGWGMTSALWAMDSEQAVGGTLRFVGQGLLGLSALAAAMALPSSMLRPARHALIAGALAAVVLYLIQLTIGHPLAALSAKMAEANPVSYSKRGVTILVMLIWPLHMILRRQASRPVMIGIGLALVLVVIDGYSSTGKVALLAAILTEAIVLVWPRRALIVMAGTLVAVVLAMPLAARSLPSPHYTIQHWSMIPNSAHHRLTIWSFVSERIAERPLLGWGLNASRTIPGADTEIVVKRRNETGRVVNELSEAQLPLHPHNAILQMWLELGLPGALTLAALLVWVLGLTRSAEPRDRADLNAMVVSTVVVAAASYGLWQGWWQTALWLMPTLAVIALKAPASRG